MADYTFKGYDNFVLEEKIDSIIATKMDMNRFMTLDSSLTEQPGMVKKIHTYTAVESAEDLARGEGNSEFVDAEYTEREYRVGRTQSQAKWYDDDIMTDSTLIDTKVQGVAESMVNNWTRKAIAEYGKTSNVAEFSTYELGEWADAIAMYTNVFEDQAGLFCIASIDLIPTIRKALGDYLKYTEGYIKTGAVGDVLGVPIYTSKALPSGMMYLATKDAVHAFLKKNTRVEQDRDVDKKENFLVADRYSVIALYDERKCIACGEAQEDEVTITEPTAADVKVEGTGTDGATVTLFINGVEVDDTVVESGAYEIACDALKSGDKVKVVAVLEGYLASSAEVTVA